VRDLKWEIGLYLRGRIWGVHPSAKLTYAVAVVESNSPDPRDKTVRSPLSSCTD